MRSLFAYKNEKQLRGSPEETTSEVAFRLAKQVLSTFESMGKPTSCAHLEKFLVFSSSPPQYLVLSKIRKASVIWMQSVRHELHVYERAG